MHRIAALLLAFTASAALAQPATAPIDTPPAALL
jgi:hypothetical protein